MPKAGKIGLWIMVVGMALVAQGCWEEEQPGRLVLLGDGACRMPDGSEGRPTTIGAESPDACQAECFANATPCVAVEYNANNSRCEVHRKPITKFEKVEGVACYVMK